ncbi:MAG: RecQ family zinc-binding domain-containing protein [Chitinophagaceae bacterium]|nr:RecQ family zinc-binding domain-containing protein [Chitinophagaceae bacterium]
MNTLKMLEQEGHLSFTENIFLPSQVTFKADKSILNDIENVHPQLEEIVKALLRTYEGIYENKISINEKLIAKLTRVTYEKVYADLQSLHKYGIIEYMPQKETPQIYFLLNRAPAQHININHEAYFKRKDLYKKRVDAMLEYLKVNKPCRSSFVSAYFGDDTVKPCGVCDNCLAKKGNDINEVEFKKIERFIYQAIPENGIAIKTLLQQLKVINKEKLWKVLDFLQSEKKLVVDALGNIKKVSN